MLSWRVTLAALLILAVAGLLAACGGDDDSGGSGTPRASTSTTKTAAASQTPQASPTETVDVSGGSDIGLGFAVDGTFRGRPVSGHVDPGRLTCTEVGSATMPLVLVRWDGTVGTAADNTNTQLAGELSAPDGTYHAPAGDGIANITIAGDYQGSPIWTGGSYTINADRKSGIVDLVFGDAPEQVTLKGTFTCS